MPILKVQFPHPRRQKEFNPRIGYRGYRVINENYIREWNNDEGHYRKFLLNKGDYLNDIGDLDPKTSELFFWGEWEGNSFFSPINQTNNAPVDVLPNGIHEPFHSTLIRGFQNTDPYVFGDYFKYCVCKQKGKLCHLDPNSLILFGSVYPPKFYVDTVFVVRDSLDSIQIQQNGAVNYTQVYKEETLNQLPEYLQTPHITSNNKLYHSQTWWGNKNYFSFVPVKLNHNGSGFERMFIELDNPLFALSQGYQAISYLPNCNLEPEALWLEIARLTVNQGFKLGIRFVEPNTLATFL